MTHESFFFENAFILFLLMSESIYGERGEKERRAEER